MKLSIITINLNNRQGLAATISSVLSQTSTDFEYIIIDGGSTDGSQQEITAHAGRLAHWVSEPDAGIFSAMNKGISAAKGEYLLMLNSGDRLAAVTVIADFCAATATGQQELVYGNLLWEEAGGTYRQEFPEQLNLHFFQNNGFLGHQASFIKRTLHQTAGYYDNSLRFAADWKFFLLAICSHGASYRCINLTVSVCDRAGLSCNPQNLPAILNEKDTALMQHFSLPLQLPAAGKELPESLKRRTVKDVFEHLFFVKSVVHN